MDDAARRVAGLYREGPGRELWDRIEDERPRTYPEENVALGRREEAALLLAWLEDRPAGLAGQRILDAGCGRGRLALTLASRGARVCGVDLTPRFTAEARAAAGRGELALSVGDFRDLRLEGFDALVLREVIQDYRLEERRELLRGLAGGGPERVLLTLRLDSRWSHLVGRMWPRGMGGTVDPVAILRTIHLVTPYRLTRQREVKRRNFRSWAGELTRKG
jgi:magnesium-protoporphyrin O-methyltransferase